MVALLEDRLVDNKLIDAGVDDCADGLIDRAAGQIRYRCPGRRSLGTGRENKAAIDLRQRAKPYGESRCHGMAELIQVRRVAGFQFQFELTNRLPAPACDDRSRVEGHLDLAGTCPDITCHAADIRAEDRAQRVVLNVQAKVPGHGLAEQGEHRRGRTCGNLDFATVHAAKGMTGVPFQSLSCTGALLADPQRDAPLPQVAGIRVEVGRGQAPGPRGTAHREERRLLHGLEDLIARQELQFDLVPVRRHVPQRGLRVPHVLLSHVTVLRTRRVSGSDDVVHQ